MEYKYLSDCLHMGACWFKLPLVSVKRSPIFDSSDSWKIAEPQLFHNFLNLQQSHRTYCNLFYKRRDKKMIRKRTPWIQTQPRGKVLKKKINCNLNQSRKENVALHKHWDLIRHLYL